MMQKLIVFLVLGPEKTFTFVKKKKKIDPCPILFAHVGVILTNACFVYAFVYKYIWKTHGFSWVN